MEKLTLSRAGEISKIIANRSIELMSVFPNKKVPILFDEFEINNENITATFIEA